MDEWIPVPGDFHRNIQQGRTYDLTAGAGRNLWDAVIERLHRKHGGVHRVDNGLLLRSDVHTLFDRGYVTVTPSYRFAVGRRLKDDFDNGEHYYRLDKSPVWLPPTQEDHPSPELLEWHSDTIFKR